MSRPTKQPGEKSCYNGLSPGIAGSPDGYHGAEGYRADGDGPAGLDSYQQVGARYYDQLSGSFLTRDTDLSQSPYAYCDGDPVNLSDPSGHSMAVGLAAVGAVVGMLIGIVVVLFVGPEVVAGAAIYEAVNIALESDVLFSTLAGGVGTAAGGVYGGAIGENLDKLNEHGGEAPASPKKGIGWRGDTATEDMHQDWHQGKGNNWYPYGAPYSGAPHGPPVPPGAILHH